MGYSLAKEVRLYEVIRGTLTSFRDEALVTTNRINNVRPRDNFSLQQRFRALIRAFDVVV